MISTTTTKLCFISELQEKNLQCKMCQNIVMDYVWPLYLFDQILVQKLLLNSLEKQGNCSLLTDGTYQGNLLQTGQHRTGPVHSFIFILFIAE